MLTYMDKRVKDCTEKQNSSHEEYDIRNKTRDSQEPVIARLVINWLINS